eukprot:scaffold105460_cov42-Phaeocystis_antarctica.AAC.1
MPHRIRSFCAATRAFAALFSTPRPTRNPTSRSPPAFSVERWAGPRPSYSRQRYACSVTCTAIGTSVYATWHLIRHSRASVTPTGQASTPPPASPSTWVPRQ